MLDNSFMVDNKAKEKLRFVSETLDKFAAVADAYTKYVTRPRSYGTEDLLYMREAHFIQMTGKLENPEIGEISKLLKVTPGAASQTAARLEAKGIIERKKSPRDSRVVICRLTEKGQKIFDCHQNIDNTEFLYLAQLLEGFGQEDMDKVYEFLDIINRFFSREPE